MTMVTWNMQGGTNSIESKWVNFVQQLVKSYGVVCLQEAGALPSTAVPAMPPAWATPAPPAPFVWQYATWNIGTSSRPTNVYILWGKANANSNRINLAICSLTAPAALLYAPPGLPTSRPGIGMQFGGANFFTLHAFSGGGGDAGPLLTNINTASNGTPWFALGDYNREPTWAVPVGVICPPDRPTHQGGGRLDYMVKSAPPAQLGRVQTEGSWSDHMYVAYT